MSGMLSIELDSLIAWLMVFLAVGCVGESFTTSVRQPMSNVKANKQNASSTNVRAARLNMGESSVLRLGRGEVGQTEEYSSGVAVTQLRLTCAVWPNYG